MNELSIYTDGACSGNPGPGGWGVVMIYRDDKKELSGFEPATTNNRMELTAVIRGLSAVKAVVSDMKIYTDSKYVANAVNQKWIQGWVANGWRTSAKKPVANRDLWEQLMNLNAKYRPAYVWVKGHSTNAHNNRCDELAVAAIKANC